MERLNLSLRQRVAAMGRRSATPCKSEDSLDVHFVNTLPVLAASCHSRESGNPGDEGHENWMPVCASMTFYWPWHWYRTYETDI